MSARSASRLPPSRETPEGAALAFAQALGAGDPEGAAACFAAGARLLTPDGTELCGRASIRGILAQLTASHPRICFTAGRVLAVDSLALVSQRWAIASNGAGERFEQAFTATLTLRRDGERWHILIAAPWGWR